MSTATTIIGSRVAALVPGTVIGDHEIGPRAPWSAIVAAGDVLTIVDLYGNQAVDTLFFGATTTRSATAHRRPSPRRATSS